MADADLDGGSNTTPSLIEQLGKAFLELEARNDVAEEKVLWKEIEDHFRHLETVMEKKSSELEDMEKMIKEEESYFSSLLAEREAAVAAKEQDMLDQIQELKDAAVAAIAEARANHQPTQLEPMDVGDSKESKVSSSLGETNAHFTDPEEESPHKTGENTEGVAPEVIKPRPELTQLCEQIDAKGLLNFITENQTNIPAMREEISVALESATEPGRLVLASLEGFYPPDETTQEGDKKNAAALQGMRESCLVVLEAMATLLARADPSGDKLANPEIKQEAKAISDAWKPKLADAGIFNAANGNSLEAQAFLQLLATFRIASEFDEEELCKLVLAASQHRQAPALCRSLGLTHKMPGIIEALNESGKQIDAVHFVHEFQLTESYPLASLLRTYLKDLRRNSQGKGSKLGNATGAQNDANAQELAAVKAVIQCIQEYKLEAEYPLDPLQRRAAQLDRSSKPDRKRFVDVGRPQQFKKPRANGGFYGGRAALGPTPAPAAAGRQAPPVYGERAYAGIAERYPAAGLSAYNYQAPTSQQGYDQRSYYHPQDERVAATAYNSTPASYGGYTSHQPYM